MSLKTTSGGSVTDASDNTVEPVTTNSIGGYTFSNLLPGTYNVVVSEPSGYTLEGTTTSTYTVTVATAGTTIGINEGVYTSASVSGTITNGLSDLSDVDVSRHRRRRQRRWLGHDRLGRHLRHRFASAGDLHADPDRPLRLRLHRDLERVQRNHHARLESEPYRAERHGVYVLVRDLAVRHRFHG